MKVRTLLNESIERLRAADKQERAAYELLKKHLQIANHELYLKMDDEVDPTILRAYEQDLNEYLHDKPLQYILGYETFMGRDFIVNENVLIPRYETEELVEQVLYHLDDYFSTYDEIVLADVGCGSGAIAISLALDEPKTKVIATDIAASALAVAQQNKELLQADVTFMAGDMLEPLLKKQLKVDVLVSNPPYIPAEQPLDRSVRDFEPHLALFGGQEGLDFYAVIFKDAAKVLKARALLAFEIGYDQKEALTALVEHYFPKTKYQFLKDMSGKNRMLFIYWGFAN